MPWPIGAILVIDLVFALGMMASMTLLVVFLLCWCVDAARQWMSGRQNARGAPLFGLPARLALLAAAFKAGQEDGRRHEDRDL